MIQILPGVFLGSVIGIIAILIWIFFQPISRERVRDLKCGKKKFIQLSLMWCSENLGKIKHPYQLRIHYYRHRKFGGWYMFNNKMIRIYVHNELYLIDLVGAVIHEYIHLLQFEKKESEHDFHKKLKDVGYWDNPYEVEARKLAQQYRNECLKWILQHNQLF